MTGIDWEAIFWETRGYLDLEDDDAVPRDELLETAVANGWSKREFSDALRSTEQVEFDDGVGSGLQLVDVQEDDTHDDDQSEVEIPDNPDEDDVSTEDLERVELDLSASTDGLPTSLRDDGQRWLLWQYRDDRKIPRNPRWGHSEDDDARGSEWSLAGAKDPRAWFEFDGAERWTTHDSSLGLAYYLVAPDRDDWEDDEKYDWVDVDEDVPDTRHVGLADFDNIRDPETGAIAPKAVPWLERFGVTFCEWSPSGTGAHALGSFTLPGGAKEIHIDVSDEEWPDAEIEVYPGRRYTTVTGEQIPGSADDVENVQPVIDALVDEHPDAVQEESSTESSATGADYRPAKSRGELADLDVTHDYEDVIDAVNQLQPSDLPLSSTYVADENSDFESWDPGYRASSSGRSLKHIGDGQFLDMKKMHTAFGVLRLFAAEQNIISNPWDDLKKGKFREAVERARIAGAPIPQFEPPSTSSGAGATQHDVEICEPPLRETEQFDREQRWEEIQGDRLESVLDDDDLHIFGDEAGSGKTTNAALGALDRDRSHTIYFDKHEKAREFVTDDAIQDFTIDVFDDGDYYHLRGGEQKRLGHCMDADHADEDCPEHGHSHECPSMCPIYDLDKEHPTREAYEALVREVGPNKAHQILELQDEREHPWHGGECAWQAQYSDLETESFVVGVHQYMTQQSARNTGINIIDETPGLDTFERMFSVRDLTRLANTLDRIADLKPRDNPVKYTARNLATFGRGVVDVLTDVDGPDAIADLEAPTIIGNAYETRNDVAGSYIEKEEPDEDWQLADALAKTKVEHGETVLERMRNDGWEGTPIAIDVLLAAAAEAGLEESPVMQATAISPILESCPWCGTDIMFDNGARCCDDDDCDWHEYHNSLINETTEPARATTWIARDRDETPIGLRFRSLPLPSELPEPSSTVVLDATANPDKVATLFGVDRDDVHVSGDDPLEIPGLEVTQVIDGQYHAGTINQAVDEDRTLARRIQRTIETVGAVHEKPLFICKASLIPEFDFPDHAEVLHYHATRGLNRNDCDAVVCIGAPHPDVTDLERDAQLLAMGREDVHVGGAEHSTRDGSEFPPVYRKLHYEDESGRGRAVPTKHYTGLVGALFQEARESELVQAVHRVRPLLADRNEPKNAYLLTNVPTNLPVDEVATFEELADPLEALMPVSEGAVQLLRHTERVLEGDGPDGFRPESLVEQRDDGSIAMNKRAFHRLGQLCGMDVTYATISRHVNALEDVGLLDGEEYEQHAGVSYTSDPATFTAALEVLSNCGSLKVAARRRFRSILAESGQSADWLAWAREVFDLEFQTGGPGAPPDAGG